MKNYKELYFAVKTGKDINKGGFDYKNFEPKKDGDIVQIYKFINFLNNEEIQILEVTVKVQDLKIYGEKYFSYSSYYEKRILKEFNFEELLESEYWESINERYDFYEKEFENYNNNYCYEDEEEMKLECYSTKGNNINISFNKLNNELEIWNYGEEFTGKIGELKLLNKKEYDELLNYKNIVELIKEKRNVQVLENGYVIDNVYYEYIEEYGDDK